MARYKKVAYNPRKVAQRASYDRVLIVCEGETERLYFSGLTHQLRLSTVNIKVVNPRQTTPDSLLNEAKKQYRQSKREGNVFDRVYCVFDKDRHPKYQETKNNIQQSKYFYTAYTEPCFEYWLLLHFKNTTKPFNSCGDLEKWQGFKKHFPKYRKTDSEIFNTLKNQMDCACKNAKRNPCTNVHELVKYLRNIKKF